MVTLLIILGSVVSVLIAMRIIYVIWTKDASLGDDADYIPIIFGGLFWPLVGAAYLVYLFCTKVLFRETRHEKRRRLEREAVDNRYKAIKALIKDAPELVSADDKKWYEARQKKLEHDRQMSLRYRGYPY